MNNLIQRYSEIRKILISYNYIMNLINWDSATQAPADCFELRSTRYEVLYQQYYNQLSSKEYYDLLVELNNHLDQLDNTLAHEVEVRKKELDKTLKVPASQLADYMTLLSKSENVWAKAKNENNFSLFQPVLTQIINYNFDYMKYQQTPTLQGYDILLKEYEPHFTSKEYDAFFGLLKKELPPLIKQITSIPCPFRTDFMSRPCSVEKQKEISLYFQKVLCFDLNKGLSMESEHPFSTSFGTSDSRYTNHFHVHNFTDSIFSCLHEIGHCLYELQNDPSLDNTFCSGGASMAMHESQSRFYENMIGRSEAFWNTHFGNIQAICPEVLGDVSAHEFYLAINQVKNSFIRTAADELTYPLHIMIRYDLEKAIFNKEIEIKDLPTAWNHSIKEYLGIDVKNDQEGVLQDVHWAGGSFGYFPTYALGSAYAAQIDYVMRKNLDVDYILSQPTVKEINAWLKQYIHQFGASDYPEIILEKALDEPFDPSYYVSYLKDKYTKIYSL